MWQKRMNKETKFQDFQLRRIHRLIREYIGRFNIDLTGMTIFTEAASGYYLYSPVMAAMAGASKVFAVTRDSRWGKAADIIRQLQNVTRLWECDDAVEILGEKRRETVGDSDIILNQGFVRPIDSEMISWMKPTAVIPLMWETWEFRPHEIDLEACKQKGILVMGTHEDTELDRAANNGYLAWHLIAQQKIEVPESKIFVFSSGYPGRGINEVFWRNNINYCWTTFDEKVQPEYITNFIPSGDKEAILSYIRDAEIVVCHEHVHPKMVIGEGGIITPAQLKGANQDILLLHISGMIDYQGLKKLGIFIYPDREVPFGTLTTGAWEMGPRSPLQLMAAGLKVGEAMVRGRGKYNSIKEAARYAMDHSLAMDFEGENSWLKGN